MIAKFIIVGWTLFLVYTFTLGVDNATRATTSDTVLGLVVMFSLVMHFVLWCTVAFPTYMISRMFARKRSHA